MSPLDAGFVVSTASKRRSDQRWLFAAGSLGAGPENLDRRQRECRSCALGISFYAIELYANVNAPLSRWLARGAIAPNEFIAAAEI